MSDIPEEIMARALDIALAIIEADKRGYERGRAEGLEEAAAALIARADIANMLANDNVTPDIHRAVRGALHDATAAISALKEKA